MAIQELLSLTQKDFQKKYSKDRNLEIEFASEVNPVTGIIVDNPLLEYVLDRRYLAYGRCYLTYGKKGCSKTSLFLNMAKMFQAAGGDVIWIETEKAADLDYAQKQGVDLKRLVMPKCDTLQEALTTAEGLIKNLHKAYPDGNTPVLICLDSIAGAIPEYEVQADVTVGEVKIGEHARLMSGFYRRIIHPLAYEKAVFLALNQLKIAIGKPSFGTEEAEAMIGGEAPRFHSTYQMKVERTADMVKKTAGGAERKVGSKHRITCKRNKLGREGSSQRIEFDLYIDGGIDWWSPLVRKLATEYTDLVVRRGGYYYWEVENIILGTEPVEDPEQAAKGVTKPTYIPTDKGLREAELAGMIQQSTEAKEMIRKAFGIPDLPPESVITQVEEDNKKKRGKKKVILDEDEVISIETL
jgi:RecA/RadA recombinase